AAIVIGPTHVIQRAYPSKSAAVESERLGSGDGDVVLQLQRSPAGNRNGAAGCHAERRVILDIEDTAVDRCSAEISVRAAERFCARAGLDYRNRARAGVDHT